MPDLLVENEIEILKKTVQSFIKEHVLPAELSPKKYVRDLPEEVITRLKKVAKRAGLEALHAKAEWGGAGLSLPVRAVLLEEAAKHRLGLYHPAADAFGGEFPSFLEKCTKQQIDTYIKPAISQGKGCFVAVWEEQEDNHLENLTAIAVRQGNEWVINGDKAYIQNMDQSTFGVVLVNCQLEEGDAQPTLFLLDADLLEMKETVLIDVQTTHSVTLNNFRVHDSQRIGAVGEGLSLVRHWLAELQVLLGAKSIGIAVKALEYGKQYAKLRITRGKPLAEFPTIRSMLANAVLNLKAARLMVGDAAHMVEALEHNWQIAAQMAKLHATETASKVIDDVLQIHGGSGYAGDLPIERWYKEIRLARLNLQKAESIMEDIADTIL
ncbi:acyl-CoA dehydrogenase family protein [Neobacillus citreus]|uniref:Acyl-CoA/acyl-ACP dehydrogenase n=1 Tax=Neobacillus citreus TaxID=2833578 RepID=A0A942STF8_9BACI|nr:acyl-CoA dehydrogenase family protein [Neobacillus citreus]MCH6264640.1 acyl-CoA/acyl-ACP dehydrogenase [Neobacillus citreus]